MRPDRADSSPATWQLSVEATSSTSATTTVRPLSTQRPATPDGRAHYRRSCLAVPIDELCEPHATGLSRPPRSGGAGTSRRPAGRRIPGPTSVPWRRARRRRRRSKWPAAAGSPAMTSGAAESQFTVVLWYEQLASSTGTRGYEVTGTDRGSRQPSCDRSAAEQGDQRARLSPNR